MGVAGSQGQARVPVIASPRRDDSGTPGVGTGQLEGKVDGLAATHGKHGIGQITRGQFCQSPAQRGTLFGDKVMVTDVQFIEGALEGVNNRRMPVTQVKDTAIAMAVDEAFFVVHIPEANAAAAAWYEIHPELGEKICLA